MSDSTPSTPIVEFFATPKPVEKSDDESAEAPNPKLATEEQALQRAVIPTLEVDLPTKKKEKLIEASRAQVQMTKRAVANPDDPSVLLQGLFGEMGIDDERSADMALSADTALHNLGVEAKRQDRLAQRAERRKTEGGGKTKRRRS